MSAAGRSGLATLVGPAVVFLLALLAFGALFVSFPVLYDTDSYYHLAIARAYAHAGLIDGLPWARLSVMHEGFGDKELFFHLLLAPFAAGSDAALGGRLALAFLNALVAASLAWLGRRAAGRWGLLLPLFVYGTSIEVLSRAVRLRPELLSLLLLLWALTAAAAGRHRLLGAISFLYALSYTAFHAFLGLAGAFFFVRGWLRRRWEWPLLLYPLVGVGSALVLHPHFPANLLVWKVQSVDFFARKAALNVGREIGPQSTDQTLLLNLGLWLALVAVWRSSRPREGTAADSGHASLAELLWVAAAAFGGLYLLMQRFSLYALPLLALAVLFELRRRGRTPGAWVRLPGRGRVPLALALAVALAIGLAPTAELLRGLEGAEGPVGREQEWATFGAAVPEGARVAAEWGSTHLYMFFAPQATYLNVLDPVFMEVRYPEAYRALRAVFEGREADVPLALVSELASDHLALSRYHRPPTLVRRLAADPRLRALHSGYTLLYEVLPEANGDFLLDWRRVPPGTPLPVAAGVDTAAWPAYPRAEDAAGRAVEGFVDAGRMGAAESCAAFVHDLEAEGPGDRRFELASYGPATAWLDGRPAVATGAGSGAVLGEGLVFEARLEAGRHRLTVLTCPGPPPGAGEARAGFYLLRRR